jgi:hypothetical protein
MGRKMIGTQLTFSQDQSQPYDAQRPQRLNWIRAIDLPPLPLGLALGLWCSRSGIMVVRQAFYVSHLFTGF